MHLRLTFKLTVFGVIWSFSKTRDGNHAFSNNQSKFSRTNATTGQVTRSTAQL